MLIKLSNNYYINPEKIAHIIPSWDNKTTGMWHIVFDFDTQLTISQAHFDELLSCLPTPVEASKIVEAKQATDTPEIRAYNLMIRALGGKP